MDWKLMNVIKWMLLFVLCFNQIVCQENNLTIPEINIDTNNNNNNNTNNRLIEINKKKCKTNNRGENLIEHNKKGYYSSHYQHEQLLRQLEGAISSTMDAGAVTTMKSIMEPPYHHHQGQQVITYDDLKQVFRTFLYQHLKIITPNMIRYARQARGGKKKKYSKFILPMVMGALLVKSLILPIVLKGLAVLSSKAVILSMISLLVASLSSLKRGARHESEKTEVQVIHVPIKHGTYKRFDDEHEHDTHEDYYHHDEYGAAHHHDEYEATHHHDEYGAAHHHDRSDPNHHHRSNHRNHHRVEQERSSSTIEQQQSVLTPGI